MINSSDRATPRLCLTEDLHYEVTLCQYIFVIALRSRNPRPLHHVTDIAFH